MTALGPGDKPKVVVRRARRVRRQQQSQQARSQQAGYGSQARSVRNVARQQQTQRQTQQARPLSPRPVRPKSVSVARVPRTARPLAPEPPHGVRAGKPVVNAQQRRGVAVAAYNELSGEAKRGHLAGARKRVQQGKATETDVAILHHHDTSVQGNRKRVAAAKAFDALSQPTHGLSMDPRVTLAKNEKPHKLNANVGSVADLPGLGKVVRAVGAASTKGLDKTPLPKIIKNIPKDAAELAVTSPSSITKFAVDAVKHPEKVPGTLAAPYKELAKDPKKFVTEHPVSSVLMLDPAARLPGRAAGKVARLAGKQTLARPAATLPKTALRETRTGSRSAGRRAVQARKDRTQPAPTITKRQVDTRVDEAYAAAKKHAERVRGSIMADAQKEAKKLPKVERKPVLELASEHAGQATVAHKRRRYAEEFGATPRVEDGRVVEQPNATAAHLHDNVADAHAVKEHLNAQAPIIKRGSGGIMGGDPAGRRYRNEQVPVEYTVRDAGFGKYAVMPKQVADRLNLHGRIGKEKAVPAVVLRQSRRLLTRAVLPYRPTWLSGQAIEGGIRSAIAGAGPSSWMRANRLQARHPDLYKALSERAVPGGQIGQAAAHEMADRTLAQELPESNIARRFTELGKTPGVKQVRALNDAATKFIFDRLNGQLLEGVPQKAVLGRALKQSPLMERHVIGLSSKAIDEAAKGLKGTETQVNLAREVERSYGKYAAFSPRLRSLIVHWTPFIPWYLNTAKFVLQTLPRDHPLATALIADVSAAEEDWRKQQGLSLRYKNQNSLPPWMLGGYPIQGGKNLLRIGHYTPAGIGTDVTGSASGLFLPQFAGVYGAIKYGKDWKGSDLKHPDGSAYNQGERALYAAAQLIESMVPGAAQGAQVLGLPEQIGGPSGTAADGSAKDRALKQLRPVSTVAIHRDTQPGAVKVTPVKIRRVKVKPVKVGGG